MTNPQGPAAIPNVWRDDHRFKTNMEMMDSVWQDSNKAVAHLLEQPNEKPFVDELAILMPNREMVMALISDAVQNGWCYFNSSIDQVRAEPMGTQYSVQYHFLKHPDRPWRMEVMAKDNGISSLHDTLADMTMSGFPVVHASFKPLYGRTIGHYHEQETVMEANGYTLAQECRSTYGAFSYWRKMSSAYSFFFKPRVNLRDSETQGGFIL